MTDDDARVNPIDVGEASHTADVPGDLRVLLCLDAVPDFCAQPVAAFDRQLEPFGTTFNDPGAWFALHALGAFDDADLQGGASFGHPMDSCILATAPHHRVAQQVVGQLMDVEVAGCRLWRYAKIEARV